ncbi:hypothetical protein HaLaN_19915, partial [Haematococcus lacustris]
MLARVHAACQAAQAVEAASIRVIPDCNSNNDDHGNNSRNSYNEEELSCSETVCLAGHYSTGVLKSSLQPKHSLGWVLGASAITCAIRGSRAHCGALLS